MKQLVPSLTVYQLITLLDVWKGDISLLWHLVIDIPNWLLTARMNCTDYSCWLWLIVNADGTPVIRSSDCIHQYKTFSRTSVVISASLVPAIRQFIYVYKERVKWILFILPKLLDYVIILRLRVHFIFLQTLAACCVWNNLSHGLDFSNFSHKEI